MQINAKRVTALLELGSGFDPNFTGRENVLLHGSLLGLTEEENRARLPEVLAFSEIGDYFENPVKTYSSGMVMRLAFASSITVHADLLIVDEALSVGRRFLPAKMLSQDPRPGEERRHDPAGFSRHAISRRVLRRSFALG